MKMETSTAFGASVSGWRWIRRTRRMSDVPFARTDEFKIFGCWDLTF